MTKEIMTLSRDQLSVEITDLQEASIAPTPPPPASTVDMVISFVLFIFIVDFNHLLCTQLQW
jgi:hypothetical protein